MDVAFHPLARQDLQDIGDLIAHHSRPNALAFVRRLRIRTMKLADFPLQGRARPEFGVEIRSVSFESRVTIVYRMTERQVVILRLLYAGREFHA